MNLKFSGKTAKCILNKKFWEELITYFPLYDTGHIEYDANNSSIVSVKIPLSLLGNCSVKIPLSLLGNGSVKIPLQLLRNGSIKILLSLLGNGSVKLPLSFLGNGSAETLPR
jgi:hypothetical protein